MPETRKVSGPKSVPECASFSARTAPRAVIPLRQAVQLLPLDLRQVDPADVDDLPEFGCVRVGAPWGLEASLALDLLFEQTWDFQEALIADLHSTLALAPREEVRLEIRTSQRKTLEQSVVDSVEELDSSEATTVDKDTMSVMRASATTRNWHVDGSGSFSLKGLEVGINAGTSGSLSQSASTAVDRVHESTKRSAESLKTLHKIEVRGLSETLVEDRVVRRIRNPYDDRTLTLNLLQLLKRYQVTTALVGTRPALVFTVRALVMDRHFVLANVAFLRSTLLDGNLATELVGALSSAKRPPRRDFQEEAREVALDALHYLFEVPNIFNIPSPSAVSNNDPKVSFDATMGAPNIKSGFGDSVANDAGIVFTTLNFFYRRYMDLTASQRRQQAVALALAVAGGTKDSWDAFATNAASLKKVLDITGFTEGLRRLSGFLAMVDGMLRPLLEPADHEREAQAAAEAASYVVDQVVAHLQCHRDFYVQRFLQYLVARTAGVTLPAFARDVMVRLQIAPPARALFSSVFDPGSAFLDRNEVVIPAISSANYAELVAAVGSQFEFPPPEVALVSEEVDVPFDGVHLEIAPGPCKLPDVPTRSELEIGEFTLRDLRANTEREA